MSYPTLTDLWHGACRAMLLARRDQVHVASLTALRFDIQLRAESMEYEFDLSKELWMTAGRFTGLQNDYLDPTALNTFIEQASRVSAKRPQTAQMQCRAHGQRHVSYKWGNCILAFTFRRCPSPTLSIHSRTTMITRMGGMDLALAYHIAKVIAEASDEKVEDYALVWHIGSLQHSSLQGVPYFLSHEWMDHKGNLLGGPRELVDIGGLDHYPVLKAMVRQLEYFDRLDARNQISRMGTRRRVREQRRAWVNGELKRKAVPLDSLNIDRVLEAA